MWHPLAVPYSSKEKTRHDVRNRFLSRLGLNKQMYSEPTPKSYQKFFESGRFARARVPPYGDSQPPAYDHAVTYKNTKSKAIVLTYQPYDLHEKTKEEIKKWVADRNLRVRILPPEYSWYYPGRTSLVLIYIDPIFDSFEPEKIEAK